MDHLGSGRGKLLLFGEHAAVYGYPAVGLSLNTSLRVRLRPDTEEDWKIEGVRPGEREKILEVLELIDNLSAAGSGGQRTGGTLVLESDIPRGLGFGSSASLCVALAAVLASWRGEANRQRIWEWAHRGEELFHGTPSGIDTGLALLGGLYAFRPHPPQLPEANRLAGLSLNLVVGAVPRKIRAGVLIGELRERMVGGDESVRKILERLGTLATEATAILSTRREDTEEMQAVRNLGELAREAQAYLGRLGLSTPDLERLLEEGRLQGALGGKLSGAGGGGAFFLLCPNPETARGTASALKRLSRTMKLATADTIHPLSWNPEG